MSTRDKNVVSDVRTPPAATPQRVGDAAHLPDRARDFVPATGAELVDAAQSAMEARSDEEILAIIADLETR